VALLNGYHRVQAVATVWLADAVWRMAHGSDNMRFARPGVFIRRGRDKK
jgi:hypothetical protein